MYQREMVARYLFARKGEWIPGYELVKLASSVIGQDYIIQDADTRAHELARQGYYESTNFKYYIEHKREGKYASFRCTSRAKLNPFIQGVGVLPEQQMTLV